MEGYYYFTTSVSYSVDSFGKPKKDASNLSEPLLIVTLEYKQSRRYYINEDGLRNHELVHKTVDKSELKTVEFNLSDFREDRRDGWRLSVRNELQSFQIPAEREDKIVDQIVREFNKEIKFLNPREDQALVVGVNVSLRHSHLMFCCEAVVARESRKRLLTSVKVVPNKRARYIEHCVKGSEESRVVGEDAVCSICLCEFGEEDRDVCRMPCFHVFHGKNCLHRWLQEDGRCPICQYKLPV